MNDEPGRAAVDQHRGIFGTTFSRGRVALHFTDDAWLQALIRVETALIGAGELLGSIPPEGAETIRRAWAAAPITTDAIGAAASGGGNPVIPLVDLLRGAVPAELREFVHLGATSQDIMDTAQMMLTRQALEVLLLDLRAAADICAEHARQHAGTPMAGRTLMQDALPITFGSKAAGWMSGLDGGALRLAAVSASLPVQYGGPVGSSRGITRGGRTVRQLLAAELGLADPGNAWHTMRLPIGDLAGALATVAGVVGKVALDIVLLAQTGIAELTEGVPGRGGSSSIPGKHNQIAAISARACAIRVPGLAATLFAAMSQEHERAAGAWHAEWETIADLVRLTGSSVAWLADSLQHLVVDDVQMARSAAALGHRELIEQATAVAQDALRQRHQRP